MEEATGAPSSFTVWDPKRLRASGRDGETVMTEPPSPLRMLLSRHTKRREFITLVTGVAAAARGLARCAASPHPRPAGPRPPVGPPPPRQAGAAQLRGPRADHCRDYPPRPRREGRRLSGFS